MSSAIKDWLASRNPFQKAKKATNGYYRCTAPLHGGRRAVDAEMDAFDTKKEAYSSLWLWKDELDRPTFCPSCKASKEATCIHHNLTAKQDRPRWTTSTQTADLRGWIKLHAPDASNQIPLASPSKIRGILLSQWPRLAPRSQLFA